MDSGLGGTKRPGAKPPMMRGPALGRSDLPLVPVRLPVDHPVTSLPVDRAVDDQEDR
jgi:hypothetical protein